MQKTRSAPKEKEIVQLERQDGAAQVICIAHFPDGIFLVKGLGYGTVLG